MTPARADFRPVRFGRRGFGRVTTAPLNPDTDTIVTATHPDGRVETLGYLRVPNWGDAASPIYCRMAEDDRPWTVWPHSGLQVADCRHGELRAARKIFGDEVDEGVVINTIEPESHDHHARRLIARSVSQTEIVDAPYAANLAARLQRACEGEVFDARRERHEYWGTTDDGDEWRVHLTDASR